MKRIGGAVAVVLLAIAAIVISSATFTVHQAEQALVLQFGKPVREVIDPGLHFKVPFIQDVVILDKRVLYIEGSKEEVPTLDQKQVVVDYFARYKIVDPLKFYQAVATEERLRTRLDQIVTSHLRRVLGEKPMARILTKERADAMLDITSAVDAEVRNFGITVIDVRMKRVDLPQENSQAIFRRMQTQREQEAARFRALGERDKLTLRAEADKQQVVIVANARREAEIRRGEGDARATAIYNEAYGRDPEFFDFFRSMQALDSGLPSATTTYVGPPTGDFFRFFGSESGNRTDGRPAELP
jgi:membrane protease subunit HflC